jgi:hypothetical protein
MLEDEAKNQYNIINKPIKMIVIIHDKPNPCLYVFCDHPKFKFKKKKNPQNKKLELSRRRRRRVPGT